MSNVENLRNIRAEFNCSLEKAKELDAKGYVGTLPIPLENATPPPTFQEKATFLAANFGFRLLNLTFMLINYNMFGIGGLVTWAVLAFFWTTGSTLLRWSSSK
jgi:hypothetical protein